MDKNYFSKIRILDGGMGQHLLAKGLKPKGSLWSATALIEKKYHQLVVDAHLDFIKSGAEVIVTNNFSARKQRMIQNNVEEHFNYANEKAGELALKAKEISTGAISALGLRIAVALGVAIGISMGAYRIVTGTPLYMYIITGYVFLLTQTYFAPRQFVPLAYDCGGVTTSTVTVPLVAALGIGLATNVPGRSPLIDGFGLIAFASLFPMMTVLGYAMITEKIAKRSKEISSTPSNSQS